ncbi:cornifelin homolog B-like [Hippocampus zosterae]|uniref:cornifelin homolog B-like n=1 Tax=Hippocampus zosterae TaxID=109293 RepID=UPI00223CECFD|nr:cornifelin homolog B-like [Hippocampus zosterae]
MSNAAVTCQPGTGGYGTNVDTGRWSTRLCSCCNDLSTCEVGCLCPCILGCYMANKYGEHCCLGCVPGGLTALRTHMRHTYGIEGTICNDALMLFFCGPCELCRMAREMRIRNGETSA